MKFPFTRPASLPLLVSFAAIAAAQTPTLTPPPVKMGLWQTTVDLKMSGMPNMPAGMATSHVSQSCMSTDTWQKDMQNLQARRAQGPSSSCGQPTIQQDGHKYTFDMQCSPGNGFTSTSHFEMLVDSDTAMHGSGTSTTTGPAFPQGMTSNVTIASKFLSADCGDVKPGQSKMVQ